MRPGAEADPITLSTVEFDVLCEAERVAERRHIVLDVPSPGDTHADRAEIVDAVWQELRARGLAEPQRDRAVDELSELLASLDRPERSVDIRIWADRSIRALACASGKRGVLVIVDGDVVELTPIRAAALAECAVSVAGDGPPGAGRSVSLPHEALREASAYAGAGDLTTLVDELRVWEVGGEAAQDVVRSAEDMGMRGQFGAEVNPGRRSTAERASRVVGFHDNPTGRYLHVVRPSGDGRLWSTIAPADNARIAEYVWELLGEIDGD